MMILAAMAGVLGSSADKNKVSKAEKVVAKAAVVPVPAAAAAPAPYVEPGISEEVVVADVNRVIEEIRKAGFLDE